MVADVVELAGRFERSAVPKSEWTHQAHLAVGLWHVDRYGPDEALTRLRSGIRRLNESHGGVNTATDGYHETITRAYVVLLHQFLRSCPGEMPLDERVTRLLDSPLAERNVLFRFYGRETLLSTRARAEWVEPDSARLDLSAIVEAAEKD
jgi:hypothetical protein